MVARKKKSKKRSGTNSSPRNKAPVLFLDENTTSRLVIDALKSAGFKIEIHRDHFSAGTEDAVWLKEVAKRKWIAITRDQRIRYCPNEIAAVRQSGARMIFVTGGNLGSAELAALLATHAIKLGHFIDQRKGPFMAKLTSGGSLTKLQ